MGKIRRKFDIEFKQQIVQEIESGQKTLSEAARNYQISASVIQRWRNLVEGKGLVERPSRREKALEAENQRLKAKVGELVMQVDHLKKLQDYAQQLKNANTSVITGKNLDQFRKGAK